MVILYGAGGHATVVRETLSRSKTKVRGLFDDAPKGKKFLRLPVFGKYDPKKFGRDKVIVTVGDNKSRKQVAMRVRHAFAKSIDPSAVVSGSASIGDGTMVLHGSIVQAQSEIGRHVIVNTGARIDHDCVIGDFAHIAPGAILCGRVTVGEGSLVGAGSVVLPGISIGKWATIGAGSVVIRDVPDGAVVAGNPAAKLRP